MIALWQKQKVMVVCLVLKLDVHVGIHMHV
jgi:hypothetical protein